MKSFILYLWQLPQNLLGLLVILFTGAKKGDRLFHGVWHTVYFTNKYNFGVSLGNYIIFGGSYNTTDVMHEYGHQRQSLYFGWLYLPVIGLTSALFNNVWDRIFHQCWSNKDREKWYYNRFPEKWADRLGGAPR